jgi:hypothetical protein
MGFSFIRQFEREARKNNGDRYMTEGANRGRFFSKKEVGTPR